MPGDAIPIAEDWRAVNEAVASVMPDACYYTIVCIVEAKNETLLPFR